MKNQRLRIPVLFAPNCCIEREMKFSPRARQMTQVTSARKPKKAIEELVVENSQRIGMKPSSRRAMIQTEQVKRLTTVLNFTSTLLRQLKMKRLGRQIMEAKVMPLAIFSLGRKNAGA